MSAWQVGDLALCVNDGPVKCPELGGFHRGDWAPAKGSIGTVVRIGCHHDPRYAQCDCVGLTLDSGERGHILRFIKITPPSADEFDREVIEMMNLWPERVS